MNGLCLEGYGGSQECGKSQTTLDILSDDGFCLFLCLPGLQFDGPKASIYEARVPFPASLCSWHLVLDSLSVHPSSRAGLFQIVTDLPSRLNTRHESEVG